MSAESWREAAMAAKREHDKLRADLARVTAERDRLDLCCAQYERSLADVRAELESCGRELQTARATLTDERGDVDALGAKLDDACCGGGSEARTEDMAGSV